jgi:hypothetical protein
MVSELKVLGFRCYIRDTVDFHYNFFYTMIQKEHIGGYLVDGSSYVGLKFQLLRHYTFKDTYFVR